MFHRVLRGAVLVGLAAALVGVAGRSAHAVAPPSRVGFPSSDPNDGRFLSMPGRGMNSLTVPTHLSIGVPSSESANPIVIEVFDGDHGGSWDQVGDAVTTYALYADPNRDGTSMTPLAEATNAAFPDAAWGVLFSAPANVPSAMAPSGHFFYRLVASMTGDPGVINGYKVAVDGVGQISAIQNEFSVIGGAVQIGRVAGPAPYDWTITSTDPLPSLPPAAPNPANTYDGTFEFRIWVPTANAVVGLQEGDVDHATDATAAVASEAALPPAPGGPPDGIRDRVQNGQVTDYGVFVVGGPPRYTIVSPGGATLSTVTDPSGNSEYETVPTFSTAQPGYYRMLWSDLDCRNTLFLKPAYGTQVFSPESTALGEPLPTGQGAIRGVVFYDRNGNGLMDAKERGVPGIPVNITNLDTGVVTTVTTNSYGEYAAGLPAGSYVASPAPGAATDGTLATTVSSQTPVVTVVNGQTRSAPVDGYTDPTGANPSLALVRECRGVVTHVGLDVALPADLTGQVIQVQYLRPGTLSLYDAVTFAFNGRFSQPVLGYNKNLKVVNCYVEDGVTHVIVDTTASTRGVVRRTLRPGNISVQTGPMSASTGRMTPLCRAGILTHAQVLGGSSTVKSIR